MAERLSEIEINRAAMAAATKRGLRSSALPDLAARARAVFRLVEGKAVAFDSDGKSQVYGGDGVTPLGMGDWAERLVTVAPHLFEANSGSGAVGGGFGGTPGLVGKNPWRKGPD